MVWPILVNFLSKVTSDISSISLYDQTWFDNMRREGYHPPTSSTVAHPQGWWWYWGN